MNKEKIRKISNIIGHILFAISIIFLMYFVVSYIDVVLTNNNPDIPIARWNLFNIFK